VIFRILSPQDSAVNLQKKASLRLSHDVVNIWNFGITTQAITQTNTKTEPIFVALYHLLTVGNR